MALADLPHDYAGDPADLFSAFDELTEKPTWWRDALCREYPNLTWFPGPGEPQTPQKAICARCAVTAECLASALERPFAVEGIWGGTSARQRKDLRSKGRSHY